jgi:hypothetical protein
MPSSGKLIQWNHRIALKCFASIRLIVACLHSADVDPECTTMAACLSCLNPFIAKGHVIARAVAKYREVAILRKLINEVLMETLSFRQILMGLALQPEVALTRSAELQQTRRWRVPTVHPGEVAGELSQTGHLGLPDQIPIATQQDHRIAQRHPFKDRQQKSASGKHIDGQQRLLECGLRSVLMENPTPRRKRRLFGALRFRPASGHGEFIANRGQGFRNDQSSRPLEHCSREDRARAVLDIEGFDSDIDAEIAMTREEEGEPVKVRRALPRLL